MSAMPPLAASTSVNAVLSVLPNFVVKSAAATAMEAEPPSTSNTAMVTSVHVLFVFYCGQ
jgi:hypothetical protein